MSATHNATHGELFATANAPYIRYLDAVARGWQKAETLKHTMRTEAAFAQMERSTGVISRITRERLPDLLTVAAFLDVRPDSSGASGTVDVVASVKAADLRGRNGDTMADEFFKALRECQSDTHLRIVFLQQPVNKDYLAEKHVVYLLTCHVLGVELNLPPADVYAILEGVGPDFWHSRRSATARHRLQDMLSSNLHFRRRKGKRSFSGAYLGRRKVGNNQPYHGMASTVEVEK